MARILFAYILLVGTLALVNAFNEHNDYILENRCGALDDLSVDTVTTIRLRDYADPVYGFKPRCRVHVSFTAKENYIFQATIRKFHLSERSPQGMCLEHFLQLDYGSENGTLRMCQLGESHPRNEVIYSTRNTLDFYYFRNVDLKPEHDVEITITSNIKPEFFTGCPNEMFECVQSGLCVPPTLKCDGTVNCNDGSDEAGCGTDSTSIEATTSPTSATKHASEDKASGNGEPVKRLSDTHIIIMGVVGALLIIALVALIAIFVIRRRQKNAFLRVSTIEPAPVAAGGTSTTPIRSDGDEEARIDATPKTEPKSEDV